MIEYLVLPLLLVVVGLWASCALDGRHSKKAPDPEPDDGSIEFNGREWMISTGTTDKRGNSIGKPQFGYKCPACTNIAIPTAYKPKWCECEEYPKGHYHFVCDCGFKAVMRTKS